MMLTLTEDDEGKRVVGRSGTEVGTITSVDRGRAIVEPDTTVPGRVKRKLRPADTDTEQYVLQNSMVHSITEREVRIRR